ncbi:dimethylaniline monooxygenase [Favolaschia claudopus]|uniref:Dimethylaniline monooxygenase n=1 Tax=Favolaschia claudopus TaxID=2862362 RepID=A0AAW0CT32_9AGAR
MLLVAFSLSLACALQQVSASSQFAFHAPTDTERSNFVNSPVDASNSESESYQFKWPIRNVAIIGAGVSGLLAYRELVDAGFEIRMFERDAIPGGIWHYTDETPVPAPIPNEDPKIADYEPSLPPQGVPLPFERWYADHNASISTAERWRRHRAPHGVWKSLTSNVPAPLMHFNGLPFPPETPWHIPQDMLVRYIRSAYSFFGINSNDENPRISYGTRVELVKKRFDENGMERGWRLTLKKFDRSGTSSCKEVWWTEVCPAKYVVRCLIILTRRTSMPLLLPRGTSMPRSCRRFRAFRKMFSNKSVLMVGAGVSYPSQILYRGMLRRADIHRFVKHKRNYLSLRVHSTTPLDFLQLLPHDVQIVPGIERFHASNGTIQFSDGTTLSDIDHIVFSTGYQYTFPFLPQYHNSSIPMNEEGPEDQPQPLVTDGSHYRSLYRDFIYIEEPTLVNLNTVTWTFGEYFAIALARVWSGTARLPNQKEMWKEYRHAVADRGGYGKGVLYFNFVEYIKFFSGWLNSAAFEFGGKTVDGLPGDYFHILKTFLTAFFANRNPVKIPSGNSSQAFVTTGGASANSDLLRLFDHLLSTY